MIVARLCGGLGNQMFQYACARRLAHARGTKLMLDLSAYQNDLKRHYALDGLRISAEVATANDVAAFRNRVRWQRRLPEWLPRPLRGDCHQVVQERSFAFDPRVLELRADKILLEGYWQSERYFGDIAHVIRQEFTMKAAPNPTSAALAARIADSCAVSIHIRRGDYISDPEIERVYGACGLDYYQRAIEEIVQFEPKPQFFVFSDEPAWVKDNLRLNFPMIVVEHMGAESPYEELRLMSLCRHSIIANSSFSWWGAWLNANRAKKVIAPKRWFKSGSHDTRDLIPADWIKV